MYGLKKSQPVVSSKSVYHLRVFTLLRSEITLRKYFDHHFLYQIEEKTEDEDNENLTIKKSIKVARRKQKKDEKAKGRHSSSKPRSSKVSRDKSHVRIEGEDITSTLDSSEDKAESQFDADLILRASLYGVLFQSYVDLVSRKLRPSDAIFDPKFDRAGPWETFCCRC